jgi:phage shock protein A
MFATHLLVIRLCWAFRLKMAKILAFSGEMSTEPRHRIISWARRIEEDYKISVPDTSELEALRDEFLNNFDRNNSEIAHFSIDEKKQLFEKLKNLENHIEEFYREKEATQHQINVLHQKVDILRKGVEILDKRTWISAAFNRVLDIYKEVKAAKNEVSGLLVDMNNLLPDATSSEVSITSE